jgi:hypothetical protein
VSVIEKLLARIKALFETSRPATPSQVVEEAPAPATAVTELSGTRSPEPTTAAPVAPSAEEPPVLVAEAPTIVEVAPIEVEEAAPDVPLVAPIAPAGGLTLRLENERGTRSTFEVTRSGATIGRGPESTIQLADLSVSRKHARITYKQGAYWLSDLGSMGGTWIDGTKLAAPRRVATGQTIDIGVCRLRVVAAAEGEKTGAAKGPSNAA